MLSNYKTEKKDTQKIIVDLISFGFKKNDLPNANYLIDVRFINNPYYIDKLNPLTGLDKDVIRFFKEDRIVQRFLKELYNWVKCLLELNKNANREKITLAIGCTGGQHRSPYIVECLAKYLTKNLAKKELVSKLSVYHRELNEYNVTA